MWIRLTLNNGKAIMVNLAKYGNILQDKENLTGSILYQTDAGDDLGVTVKESFEEITAEIERWRRGIV